MTWNSEVRLASCDLLASSSSSICHSLSSLSQPKDQRDGWMNLTTWSAFMHWSMLMSIWHSELVEDCSWFSNHNKTVFQANHAVLSGSHFQCSPNHNLQEKKRSLPESKAEHLYVGTSTTSGQSCSKTCNLLFTQQLLWLVIPPHLSWYDFDFPPKSSHASTFSLEQVGEGRGRITTVKCKAWSETLWKTIFQICQVRWMAEYPWLLLCGILSPIISMDN